MAPRRLGGRRGRARWRWRRRRRRYQGDQIDVGDADVPAPVLMEPFRVLGPLAIGRRWGVRARDRDADGRGPAFPALAFKGVLTVVLRHHVRIDTAPKESNLFSFLPYTTILLKLCLLKLCDTRGRHASLGFILQGSGASVEGVVFAWQVVMGPLVP